MTKLTIAKAQAIIKALEWVIENNGCKERNSLVVPYTI